MVGIEEFLKLRAQEGLYRTLNPVCRLDKGRVSFNKKEYIDFSSNDYLGLSSHPKLKEESKKAIDKFGISSSSSRLMSGDLLLHHKLEEKIAKFKNKEAALFFNSGYQANLGIISSLCKQGDCVFFDRLSHASIIDGVILSGARFFRFRHNDAWHLEQILKKERKKFDNALIITETIFSMDGDRPPLKELVYLKDKYNCTIMVDEAHATGVFGESGGGIVQEEGLEQQIDFIMGTFSKALAGFGAYLAASRSAVQYLVNTCRSFIYSTALPPSVIAGNLTSIDLIKQEPYRRKKLLESARYFRETLKNRGFTVAGVSQIIPLIIGDNFKTKRLADRLKAKGYWVVPIRPPTVAKGQARLRFSLSFHHDIKILERLINDIATLRI